MAEAIARSVRPLRRGAIDDPIAYLTRAVVNLCNSWRRRKALERRLLTGIRGPDHALSIDDQLASRFMLIAALRNLPVRQREVLVLRYYEDFSEARIADVLGISAGSVKTHASRGLAALRAALTESERST